MSRSQAGGRPSTSSSASDVASELVFVNPGPADHLKRIVYQHQADD
jgi:hypothetical protein